MPNATEITAHEPHRFFTYGDMGAGKTAQILTLPRPTFAYIFDPNALLTLRGHDIEYEQFLPIDLSLDVVSLKKGDGGLHKRGPQVMKGKVTTYEAWERDFATRDFSKYNSIAIDSATTFLDLIMDYVLQINGRPGQWPEQDDYGPQMVTFTNAIRTFASLGKTLLCTGHYEVWQDRKTQRTTRQLMMTGRLRTKIPLLFSDVFYCEGGMTDDNKPQYTVQTVKDKEIPAARCSFTGLSPLEDVTIDFTQDLESQGLGALLAWEQEQLKPTKPAPAKGPTRTADKRK